ncbi:hypothetical protein [Aliiglaciecola sp. LCG003]|uniref:hypothetical protein n=1 Tax=Aliiglaciecola sp. LCG003 TaxID=3053655 RepID=UPI0025727D9C|nr:hypothetical protein [Aliiglaciecola sp. LCG003]WJG08563.1 hypothetical protein QR722_14635 [Aliiglaciecola sp. LCG003]
MALAQLKTLFGRYNNGAMSGIYDLFEPHKIRQEPPFTERVHGEFQNILANGQKGLSVVRGLNFTNQHFCGLFISMLAYTSQRPVRLITREFIENLHPRDLSRLFADAETSSHILLFDEADSLFNQDAHYENGDRLEVSYVHQLAIQHQGITLFKFSHHETLAAIQHRITVLEIN